MTVPLGPAPRSPRAASPGRARTSILRASELIRARPALVGAAWLFLAVNVANALAYVYQVVMNRLLEPADFAILVALFAALIIEAQGMQLVQSSAAKIVADRRAVGDLAGAAAFVVDWGRRLALVIAVPAILILLTSPIVAPLVGFPTLAVAMLGTSLFFAALFAFGAGIVQGLGRFGWLGGLLIAQAAARLVLGVVLVLAGLGVVGAFGAAAGAIAVSFFAALFPVARVLRRVAPAPRAPTVGRFFLGAAAALFAYAALVNVDALLAPVLLPSAADAGAYATAVTLGKIALFAPLGLSFFLLERTASAHALGAATRATLYRVLGAVFLVSGGVAAVYLVAPELAIRIVAGERYVASVAPLVGTYGVAALSNALLNVWIAYFVGIGRLRVGVVYAVALGLLAAALVAFAREPLVMARIVLAATLGAQAVTIAFFVRGAR